jgi:hypothetical protein
MLPAPGFSQSHSLLYDRASACDEGSEQASLAVLLMGHCGMRNALSCV